MHCGSIEFGFFLGIRRNFRYRKTQPVSLKWSKVSVANKVQVDIKLKIMMNKKGDKNREATG